MSYETIDFDEIFEERSVFQSYLDVEVALAKAQAKIGVIPKWAADTIAEKAQIENINMDRVHEGLLKTGHPLVPLIWELDRVCGEKAGGYIHWGATTQNITQTGKLLLVKQCHDFYIKQLKQLLLTLAELADRTKDYALPGRTHGQHAVPATFGYKVAVWIDELSRHLNRLKGCEERVFVTMLGGGAGTMASVGKEGIETQNLMAEILGMGSMSMPSRVIGDHITEYVTILGLISATSSKMAREVYTMMKQEFGELEEPISEGSVGSSTMPQKRNPKRSNQIVASAAEVRTLVSLSLESMQTEHEADSALESMSTRALYGSCQLVGNILILLNELFSNIQVFPDRMRKNLDLSGGLIMSERVMLELGKKIGRQKAHDAVYEAAQKSVNQARPFTETLAEEPEVVNILNEEQIADLLDPEQYTGLCSYFAEVFAEKARKEAL